MLLKLTKKILKKVSSAFFIVLMFLSTMVGCRNNNNSNQTNSLSDQYFTFTKITGGYSIALKEMPDFTTVINIPNTHKGKPVLEIDNEGFQDFEKITEVTIPNNIQHIGDFAFANCASLQKVTFGKNSKLESIGNEAFYGCNRLTSIIIPISVTSIGEDAFYMCQSLIIYCETKTKPEGWDNDWNWSHSAEKCPVYWDVTQKDIIIKDEIQYLIIDGSAVVTGHTSELENDVVIPLQITIKGNQYNVTSIGDSAFRLCKSLQSVTFEPNSKLESIKYNAFSNCTSLTSIIIPSGVTSIGLNAFEDCNSLTIYCEAEAQPKGWDNDWNPDNQAVYWAGEWSYVNGIPTPNNN